MMEIVTGSRLHFGLFQPGAVPSGGRRFGGVGMMIDRPGVRLRAESSGYTVVSSAPHHAGLGTGTQFQLAVAKLQAFCAGQDSSDIAALAARAGRGRRSGIGAHGFVHGGLLVDGGRRADDGLAPLLARLAVPESWRIVLAIPAAGRDWHGRREQRAFEQLPANDERVTESLCRLTLLGLLPALAEGDLDTFGEALYELNAKAGSLFASAQGGVYASEQVASVVQYLRGQGVRGVGQSSWGPTVFAFTAADRAASITSALRTRLGLQENEVMVSAPLNVGAQVVRS